MADYSIHPGTLYNYTAGVQCGVLVTERVMRKLARLQAKHLLEVKRLLSDSKEEVFPSMWTLHYPEGKQTHVNYIDLSCSLEDRIRSATHAHAPKACYPVFIANSMGEAQAMAEAHHGEVAEV